MTSEQIIERTEKWIIDVVIGCNFCPFAANVVKQRSIFYKVEENTSIDKCLESFQHEMERLDNDTSVETTFLIFPKAFQGFDDYLNLLSLAEKRLKKEGYEGIYQVASFHPLYLFADSDENDPANYTNRSIYPMLHLLREESIDKALENFKSPGSIPERNINFAREKGLAYMKMLRDAL
ncbi:MAG TPA: DUF1415 domain-containing protein [Chitinophagaceae bacterium]